MIVKTSSHLFAETVAEGAFRAEWEDLLGVLGNIEPPLREPGPFTSQGRPPTPKRQQRTIGRRRAFAMFPIDQAALNIALQKALRERGWDPEPVARGDLIPNSPQLGLLGDFAKNSLFVEVEFGNVASLYRDLFKFQIAARSGAGRVGVLVVATGRVAKFFDQGVATYEHALSLLPYMDIGIQLPVVIVGLDLNDWAPIRERYEEMRAVAEANGVTCHSFEAVFGADQPTIMAD